MAKRQEIPDIIGQERQRIDVLGDVLSGKPAGPDTAMIRSQLRYDYSLIPVEQRETVQDAAVEIVRNGRRAQESLLTIGQRLTEVKDMLEHGQFSDWCETEFDMSQRTAQRMMQVADVFGGKNDTVSFLTDSAMYLLSAPSTPEPAREQVIQEAQASGKSPTKTRIQEVIAQHKPAPTVVASAATGSRQQGAQLATCRICHRPLSDPASAIAGIGPCCAGKHVTAAGSGTVDDEEEDRPMQVAGVADDDDENWRIDDIIERLKSALGCLGDYEEVTGIHSHSEPLRSAIAPMLRVLESNRI